MAVIQVPGVLWLNGCALSVAVSPMRLRVSTRLSKLAPVRPPTRASSFNRYCFGAAGELVVGAIVSAGLVFFLGLSLLDFVFFGVVGSAAGA